ncbi:MULTISPECIES: hypothetical protein [unclassified Nocardioides]|uniref:hypothetical protein n=1 Tax=unclassified Nocardioides TaxID=2615069 RepID=UPI0009F124A7|nr:MULTISPECIES: hypothetical protein [unclassified Nocardioides]GAW47923.1 uncharacterized protein PD653B2_0234 [Nocardioides sp. PD653-B2]GAW53774.1 uncharacterized protein PD653_1177 [Nocardioides sp. PD653]
MNGQSGLPASAEAVYGAEQALQRAADTVEELGDVAASSLRVLDDAAMDSFYAHQDDRRAFYLESAGAHLGRLRSRSEVMTELGEDLVRHLAAASSAIEEAGRELSDTDGLEEVNHEARALRTHIDVLGEVVALAGPVAMEIRRHAVCAAECSRETDALMLLDTRVHDAGREVSRADEGVAMMRNIIESAHSRARSSAALAGSLHYAATHPSSTASPPQPGPDIAI